MGEVVFKGGRTRIIHDAPPEELYPYLDPAYWNGYTPTHTGPEFVKYPKVPVYSSLGRAALHDQFDLIDEGYKPLAKLPQGTFFDPHEHRPGTVFRFQLESLQISSRQVDVDLAVSLAGQSAIQPRLSSIPDLSYRSDSFENDLWTKHGLYTNHDNWAVVVPNRRTKKNVLYEASGYSCHQYGDRTVVPLLSATMTAPTFTIGAVWGARRMLPRSGASTHEYRRVTDMEIAGYGNGKRRHVKQSQPIHLHALVLLRHSWQARPFQLCLYVAKALK